MKLLEKRQPSKSISSKGLISKSPKGISKSLVHKKMFAIIFMAGFLLGIIYANLIGKKYMNSSGILSDYFLSRYKYFEIENINLFFYLLKERIVPYIIIWITGITIIGIPAVWGYLTWVGFSGGMLISMAVMKFGFKGILLCLGGTLPQFLIYIPVILIFLQNVYSFALMLYGSGTYPAGNGKSKKQLFLYYIWSFFLIMAVLMIGILLESYVNPYILKIILKNF